MMVGKRCAYKERERAKNRLASAGVGDLGTNELRVPRAFRPAGPKISVRKEVNN